MNCVTHSPKYSQLQVLYVKSNQIFASAQFSIMRSPVAWSWKKCDILCHIAPRVIFESYSHNLGCLTVINSEYQLHKKGRFSCVSSSNPPPLLVQPLQRLHVLGAWKHFFSIKFSKIIIKCICTDCMKNMGAPHAEHIIQEHLSQLFMGCMITHLYLKAHLWHIIIILRSVPRGQIANRKRDEQHIVQLTRH